MEESYYNVKAPLGDRMIVYNTRRRGMVELDGDEALALENPRSCRDEGLLRALRDEGFIVDNAEAEADELLYRQHQYRNSSHIFELTITPSRTCNFDCDYCYVPKRAGTMSAATQKALMAFVAQHYERSPFKEMRINWYGGEPMLHIDAMEQISAPLIAFCEEHEVTYIGHILSNASLADERMCERLVKNCAISSVMPSISGYGDMHDYQRPAKNGEKYFDTILRNIDCMIEAGITVHVNYVTNHNNIEECTALAKKLCDKKGLRTRLSKTGAFGKDRIVLRDGKETPIELFSPEEFAPCYVRFFEELNLDARGYETLLKPIPLYCAALVNKSFFIDETGDVFTCMVDMDYPEKALFNLNEWMSDSGSVKYDRFLAYANLEPIRDLECRTCRILPLCQGGCYEKYLASGELACHNLKFCIEDIVRDYHAALAEKGTDSQSCA